MASIIRFPKPSHLKSPESTHGRREMGDYSLCEPSRKARARFRRSIDRRLRTKAGVDLDEKGNGNHVGVLQSRWYCAGSEALRMWLNEAAALWFQRGTARPPPSDPMRERLLDRFLFPGKRPPIAN